MGTAERYTWTRFALSRTYISAVTLDVNLFGFAKFTTVRTLSNRSPFLLYLEERSVYVFASGRAMTFDAGITGRW